MADRLAFVEVPDQIAHVPSGYHIISLSPLVEVVLEQAGRSYTRPEDYLDERLLEEEGIANFERVEKFCRVLDEAIQREAPAAKAGNLQPAMFNFFQLKILYDAFFLRAYQVRRILRSEQATSVICFERGQPDLQREWYSIRESLYASVIEVIAQYLSIKVIKLNVPEAPGNPGGTPLLPMSLHLKPNLGRSARACLDIVFSAVAAFRQTGRVVCLDFSCNLPYIARELMKTGIRVWVWEDNRKPRFPGVPAKVISGLPSDFGFSSGELRETSERVMKNPELQSCWSWEGCIFWQAVSFRIERIFGICLPEAIRYFAWTNWVIDRVNPGLILATSMAHPRERIIAHAARSRKVPVVVSHHGALGTVYAPIHFYQDINFVDGMLCYGHGVASYVRKYTTRQPALKAVGSPRVARIVREAPSRRAIRRYLGLDVRRPIVIYVPTNMEGNRHYLSYRVPSDTTCYHMHRRIISVLGKHPEYQVVIKRHMDLTSSVIDTWVSRQDWPHVKVISHPPFSWLVNLADTLVVDLPSTVLLETLQTDSAIYLFNNWVKWEGAALDALKKVAFCSDDLDAFCERLDADLVSGKAVQPRPRDEEFLRLVCLPEQDVSSARRAAGAIQDVLKTGCMDWND